MEEIKIGGIKFPKKKTTKPKIVQLCSHANALHALDNNGSIYTLHHQHGWFQIKGPSIS